MELLFPRDKNLAPTWQALFNLLDGLLSFFDPMSTVPSPAGSDPISSITPGGWNLLFPLNPNKDDEHWIIHAAIYDATLGMLDV